MSFSFSLGLGSRGGKGGFDPAVLSLSGWWRASYSGSPWAGTASGGSSSGRNLTEGTNPPSNGTAINGLTPADFDGTNDRLTYGTTTDLITTTAWSMWALVNIDAIDTNNANAYDNDAIACESGGNWGVHLKSNGGSPLAQAYHWDGAEKKAEAAISTGAWALVQAKYNGSNILCRVNGGSWASTAAGTAASFASTSIKVGENYNAAQHFDGRIAELATSQIVLSDSDFDNVKSYINSRYGLSL